MQNRAIDFLFSSISILFLLYKFLKLFSNSLSIDYLFTIVLSSFFSSNFLSHFFVGSFLLISMFFTACTHSQQTLIQPHLVVGQL